MSLDRPPVSRSYLWVASLVTGVAGLVALLIYARSLGGWVVFLFQGAALRSGTLTIVSPWAFLANLAPLVIGTMLLLFALRQYEPSGPRRWLVTLLCASFYLASLAVLFNQAGRAWLVSFLLTLPLIGAIQRDRLRLVHVLFGGVLFILLFLFGRLFFQLARDPSRVLAGNIGSLGIAEAFRGIIWEFTFPIATLANVMGTVPEHAGLRWFYDFPLALVYIIPQRLTGIMHEPTVSMVNTAMFGSTGMIPVDVLSLGYYSLLVPGALLTATAVGAALGLGERWLPGSADPLRAGLRISWIFTLAFRIMYADPQLFWRAGLSLLLTTAVVFTPAMLASALVPHPVRQSQVPQGSGALS